MLLAERNECFTRLWNLPANRDVTYEFGERGRSTPGNASFSKTAKAHQTNWAIQRFVSTSSLGVLARNTPSWAHCFTKTPSSWTLNKTTLQSLGKAPPHPSLPQLCAYFVTWGAWLQRCNCAGHNCLFLNKKKQTNNRLSRIPNSKFQTADNTFAKVVPSTAAGECEDRGVFFSFSLQGWGANFWNELKLHLAHRNWESQTFLHSKVIYQLNSMFWPRVIK